MSKKARVRSTDSLEFLLARLVVVGDDLAGVTAAARSSANRGLHRIRVEERARWTRELELATKGLKEAKAALSRAELQKDIGKPSVVEEKRDLERASTRHRRAEEKLGRVSWWSAKLQKAEDEFQGSVAPLRAFAIGRLDRAGADLEKTLDLLFEYMRVSAPSSGGPDTGASEGDAAGASAPGRAGPVGVVRARVKSLDWPGAGVELERVGCPAIEVGVSVPVAAVAGEPPRVLCESGVDPAEPCFLARTRMGWVIGSVSERWGELREVGDPGPLRPMLGLPIGCIVLVREGRVAEVVDRFDMPIRGVVDPEEERP